MRILVTGATGLLGTDLCQVLVSDHEVFGWARNPREIPGMSMGSVDITDDESVTRAMERVRPHVVVHTAALSDVDSCQKDPPLCMKVNRDGTKAVAHLSRKVGAYLVAISTDYVFDGSLARPKNEADPTYPVNVYGVSKLEAEREVRSLREKALIVRVSGLFGQGRPNFVSETIRRLRSGERIKAVIDQVNSPSYTADVAEGLRSLIELYGKDRTLAESSGPISGILHLANPGSASRFEVAQAIAEELGVPKDFVSPGSWAEMGFLAPRPTNSALNCERFARITQAPLRPWREALHAYLEALG